MGILWARSGSVEFDNSAVRAAGAKAYFYVGNTTTPLDVYTTASEVTPRTSPVEADANGRWPDVFIPYITSYDVKITTSAGTQLSYPTQIPNPNPVTAAADTVPAEARLSTGDIFFSLINTTRTGCVRLNGRTIGSATSGATERAHADTEDLYGFLWSNLSDSFAPVSGGRGGSAAADFAANKAMQLPDRRGMGLAGYDTMGNAAAGRMASAPVQFGDTITSGSILGDNLHALSTAQLPIITPAGTISTITPTGTNSSSSISASTGNIQRFPTGAGSGTNDFLTTIVTGSVTSYSVTGTAAAQTFTGTPTTPTFTGTAFGSGNSHNNLSMVGLVTWYIKL